MDIFISVISSLICGYYVSIIMAKYSAFCQVRLNIFAVCRRFSYGSSDGKLSYAEFPRYTEIADNASNLLYLGHKEAGEEALKIFKEVANTRYSVEVHKEFLLTKRPILPGSAADITFEVIAERCLAWQRRSQQLKPALCTLFSLRPRL